MAGGDAPIIVIEVTPEITTINTFSTEELYLIYLEHEQIFEQLYAIHIELGNSDTTINRALELQAFLDSPEGQALENRRIETYRLLKGIPVDL